MVLLIKTNPQTNTTLQALDYKDLTNDFKRNVAAVIDDAEILGMPFPNCVTFNAHTLLNFITSAMASNASGNPVINAFNIKFTKLSGNIVHAERFNPVNTGQVSVIIEPASVEWGERIIPATGEKIFDIITSRTALSSDLGALDFGTISPPY